MSESSFLQNLKAYFNESELRDLCFDVAIDYESVLGQTKGDKARELILYCKRFARSADLVQACRRLRPRVSWDDLPSETLAATPSEILISTGLGALVQLLQSPDVRSAAGGFQMVFRTACDQIKALGHYKLLHDLFQELETIYDVLEPDCSVLTTDPAAWEHVLLNAPALNDAIQELLACVDQSPITRDRPVWAQHLDQAREALHGIVTNVDSGVLAAPQLAAAAITVRRIMERLNRILDREPSRINNLLVDRAHALHLSALVEAMTSVRDQISLLNQELIAVRQFDAGLHELMQQRDNLAEQVRNHGLWQEIDDELRRVKNNLGNDLDELELSWPDLHLRTHALCADSSATWAVGIIQASTQLEGALRMAVKAPERIRRYFYTYRRKATQHFRHVDDDLLRLCDDLQKTGAGLDQIIQALQ